MSLELQSNPQGEPSPHIREQENDSIQVLPPADRGAAAWKFIFAAFVLEGLLWGFPVTFGVFQDYYSRQPEFKTSSNIALIGALPTSIYFLGAPFATPLVKKFQRWQRHMVVAGWAICVLSLLAASFATTVLGLMATQGVMYGVGFSLLYFPVLRMLDEWFIRRRGFAYGILAAGGGCAGVGLPFLLELLLSKFGYQTTLRAVAVGVAVLIAPILPWIKGRLPTSNHIAFRMMDMSFLSQPLFYCFALSNLFQSFGFYIPSLYLPSFASALGLSGTIGALLLATNNLATVIGQVCVGYLTDRLQNILILVFILPFVSSIAAFTIWGFANSLGALMAFSIVYGWFAGAFAILWPKFGSILSEDPQPVYSMMLLGKGIGSIAIGPISAGLLNQPISAGYGIGKFQPLILFLGGAMFCSSMGVVGWPLRRRQTLS
ncbi:MFS general substrate transporter [Thozetella sp. PMI_491]|nr:MFS general substrate transporter [Thozetella sp. PMI_491]